MASSVWVGVVAVFAASGVLSIALAVSGHRRRDVPAAAEFRDFALAGGVWALVELGVMLAPSERAALLVESVGEALAIVVVVTFLVFVFEYAQSPRFSGPTARRGLYALVPAYWLLFVVPVGPTAPERAVSSFHGLLLVERAFGPVYAVWTAFTFLFVFAAWWNLLRLVLDSTNVYRKQSAVVFVSSLLVAASAVALMLGLIPAGFQLSVAMRAVEATLIWVAIFRYDFLSVMPLARDALVDAIENPVVVVDEDDTVVFANDGARALSPAVDRGAALDDALPGLTDAIDDDAEYHLTVDGEERIFAPSTTPLVDHYDAVRGRVVLLGDVTERKRRERRLEEFASMVSHDLRNPLAVADGYVRRAHDRTGEESLEQAIVSIERMDEMIDELLALAREGHDAAATGPVDVATTAREAWRTVATDGARLVTDAAEDAVVADEHQLREIFENLFRNAVEHGVDGTDGDDAREVDLTVAVGTTDDGFYVADDGVGIPADARDQVFDTGYTTAPDGTGVGLHVVERFAEAHGWTVTATASDEGGARFEFDTGED